MATLWLRIANQGLRTFLQIVSTGSLIVILSVAMYAGEEAQDSDLLHAVFRNDLAKVQALLDAGVNPNTTIYSTTPDSKGMRIFEVAIMDGKVDIVECFVTHGADLKQLGLFNLPSLVLAIRLHRLSVAQVLLKHGADPNQEFRSLSGLTSLPLDEALQAHAPPEEIYNFVKLLIEQGADPSKPFGIGETSIDLAIENPDDRNLQLMLMHGIDLYRPNKWGVTPIRSALQGGHEHSLQMLYNDGQIFPATGLAGAWLALMAGVWFYLRIISYRLSTEFSAEPGLKPIRRQKSDPVDPAQLRQEVIYLKRRFISMRPFAWLPLVGEIALAIFCYLEPIQHEEFLKLLVPHGIILFGYLFFLATLYGRLERVFGLIGPAGGLAGGLTLLVAGLQLWNEWPYRQYEAPILVVYAVQAFLMYVIFLALLRTGTAYGQALHQLQKVKSMTNRQDDAEALTDTGTWDAAKPPPPPNDTGPTGQ